jgi:YesN/AraC family two-component response regulator
MAPSIINEERVAFNELTFVLKGKLDYVVNGKPYAVNQGDAIYISSGSIRQRETAEICDYISFNFYREIEMDMPVALQNCVSEEMLCIFDACDKIYSKYNDWFDKIDLLRKILIKLVLSNIEEKNESPIISKTIKYIRNNLSQKITLQQLAKEVSYSPNYLDAIFKKSMGVSVINYIIFERINYAKRLIDEGILSLKDISETVGISDYNYFCRLFKKVCSQSPSSYRALIHGKKNKSYPQ